MKVLIDGDILLYRIGYSTEDVSPWIARARMDETINNIMDSTGGNQFQIYLSDNTKNTHRYKISQDYKANRVQPRPRHYEFLKIYLIEEYLAEIVAEMEADDMLGIMQDKEGKSTIIASIDKDLLQIPGLHYDIVKHEFSEVSKWGGMKWFYSQMLIGDSSDNVKGCPGIGKIKANKLLEGCEEFNESVMFECVLRAYIKQLPEENKESILERIRIVGQLVKIMQRPDEGLWQFPVSMEIVDEMWEASSALRHPRGREETDNRSVSS